MSTFEQQILNTDKYNEQAITAADAEVRDILYSFLSEEQLHRIINNPIEEGIDKG